MNALDEPVFAIFKQRSPDPGVCRVTRIDWEMFTVGLITLDRSLRFTARFNEIELVQYPEAQPADSVTFTLEATMPARWVPQFLGMLRIMEQLGSEGSSREVTFVSDGDGDFQPKFKWGRGLPSGHLLIDGNPVDGFQFHGPFTDAEEAGEYATLHTKDNWWVAGIQPRHPDSYEALPLPTGPMEITSKGYLFDAG